MAFGSYSPLALRFQDFEVEFLAAASSTDSLAALTSFKQNWAALCDEFQYALGSSAVSDLDKEVALSVLTRIAEVSERLAGMELTAAQYTSAMMDDVEEVFTRLSVGDTVINSPVKRHSNVQRASFSAPPYSQQAYAWLVQNIHDPYPPPSLRLTFARLQGVSARSMEEWFKSMRRHIGWVDLCKRHFRGKRSLAVAAARRVFLGEGDIPVGPEVGKQLADIKSTLKTLYVLEHVEMIPFEEHQTRKTCRRSYLSRGRNASVDASCPSASLKPSPPSRTPSLSYSSSDTEDDEPLPELSPLSLGCSSTKAQLTTRPLKRHRTEDSSKDCVILSESSIVLSDIEEYGNILPPLKDLPRPVVGNRSSEELRLLPELRSRLSRKRRLLDSDADSHSSHKRSRVMEQPRVVSESHLGAASPPACLAAECDERFGDFDPRNLSSLQMNNGDLDLSFSYTIALHDFNALPPVATNHVVENPSEHVAALDNLNPNKESSKYDTPLATSVAQATLAPTLSQPLEIDTVFSNLWRPHELLPATHSLPTTRSDVDKRNSSELVASSQAVAASADVHDGGSIVQELSITSRNTSESRNTGQEEISWPVFSDAQWEDLIQSIAAGQRSEAPQCPPALGQNLLPNEPITTPLVDVAYDVVQGSFELQGSQTGDETSFHWFDLADFVDFSPHFTDITGLPVSEDF